MNAAEFLRPEGWLDAGGGPRYVQLRRRLEDGAEFSVRVVEGLSDESDDIFLYVLFEFLS